VAPIPLVLRHLGAVPQDLDVGRLDPLDRIELALEHALRLGHSIVPRRGEATPGDSLLRDVLRRRGEHRPTGSYAETRLVQRLRSWGLMAWRQVEVRSNGVFLYRADAMVPFDQRRPEPVAVCPADGVLMEVDSEEHHIGQFHRDQHRNSTYDRLAYQWVAVSPHQIERQPLVVARALEGAFARASAGKFTQLRVMQPDRGPITA
jgi:hypothetical protein